MATSSLYKDFVLRKTPENAKNFDKLIKQCKEAKPYEYKTKEFREGKVKIQY